LEYREDPLIPGIKENYGTEGSHEDPIIPWRTPKAGSVHVFTVQISIGYKGFKYLSKILLFFMAYYTQLPYDRNW
jgi:hypothetical protein